MRDFDEISAATFLSIASYGTEIINPRNRAADDPIGLETNYERFLEDVSSGRDDLELESYLSAQMGQPWTLLTENELNAAGNFFSSNNETISYGTEINVGSFSADGLYEGLNAGSLAIEAGFATSPSTEQISDSRDGQALLAETEIGGETTLVLAFRGTDGGDPVVTDGQTYTRNGLSNHYESLRPLVQATSDYAVNGGIENVIVTGHSLGGSMVDVFSLVDARDLFLDQGIELTAIAFATPGVTSDLARIYSIDEDYAEVSGLVFDEINSLSPPPFYTSVAHSEDRVGFPDRISSGGDNPPANLTNGFSPTFPLLSNLRFGDIEEVDLSTINNLDVSYGGFGAEHNSTLYQANINEIAESPLLPFYENGDYDLVLGRVVDPMPGGFTLDTANDQSIAVLRDAGTDRGAFILSGAGSDNIDASGTANHLLDGGEGNDEIRGGQGNDIIFGGAGDDLIFGGNGFDTAIFEGSVNDYFHSSNAIGDEINRISTGETDTLVNVERFQFDDATTDRFLNPIGPTDEMPDIGWVNGPTSLASAIADGEVVTAEDAIKAGFGGFFGFDADNINYTGAPEAAFLTDDFRIDALETGLSSFDYGSGIMLSSGGFPGTSNSASGFTVSHGTGGDPELTATAQAAFSGAGGTNDASVIEFTVDVTDPEVDALRASLVFGSEEFPEYVDSSFVDIAGVYVDGVNYAGFEATEQPLSVISDNLASGVFVDNEPAGSAPYGIEWDGFSKEVSVRAPLEQGENTVKIGVADTGDTALDSGLFISDLTLLGGGGTGGGVLSVVTPDDTGAATASVAAEEFVLESGAGSTISGSPGDFDGDVVTGFDSSDSVTLLDTLFGLSDITFSSGSVIMDIDTDADGDPDTNLTFAGQDDPESFVLSQQDGSTIIGLESDHFAFNALNDFSVLQGSDPALVGKGDGDDVYFVSNNLIGGLKGLTISDTAGSNRIELAPGLDIVTSQVASDAVLLTLSDQSTLTILDADQFTYAIGANATTGENVSDIDFDEFVTTTLGVAGGVPASGVVEGANVTIPGGVVPIPFNGDDYRVLQPSDPSILGSGDGLDVYLLSNAMIGPNQTVTVSDASGANVLELAPDLEVDSSQVAAEALQLTLANGAEITVLDADDFLFEVGANTTANQSGDTRNYADFVEDTLGIVGGIPTSGVESGGDFILT